jgi:hypothetical protein
MQYVENDMDDLFRKAAQNYPLKTEAKGWDDIAGVLAPQANREAIIDKKSKRKNRWLIFLVFLMVSSVVSFFIYTNNNVQRPSSNAIVKNIPVIKNAETVEEKINNIQNNSIRIKIEKPVDKKNKIKYQSPAGDGINIVGQNRLNKNFKQLLSTHINSGSIENTDGNFVESTLATNNVPSKELTKTGKDYPSAVEESEVKKNKQIINSKDSAAEVNRLPANKVKASSGRQGFYFGVVAGPQFSQVKGQGFTKTGFDAGLLAGFRFNKKFSAEAGLLYAAKHYYSDGKYFDMTKTASTMPANMKLINLKGSVNVFEVQAKLKYDFITAKKSSWFIGTGISSYILTQESNDYFADVNGVQQNLHAKYESNKGYFLTVVDVSFGNEFKIGKRAALRIAPYWQIPLKGMGVGAMSVSGAGLHIGLIFPARK